MFTLAISSLTSSSLPWFMDLTFQVPMKYCSLQHPQLGCFYFGSISSFFLELFLHWSQVAYWAPNDLGLLWSLSWYRICQQCRRPRFNSWVVKIHCVRDRLPTPEYLGFTCAHLGKNPPAMQETWVRFLGWEDPLEKGQATYSSVLAWRIPWTV